YPPLLRRAGLHNLARWYVAMQDRCFRHRTLLSKETWEGLFRSHGFQLLVSRKILPPRLTRWWDFLLPAALPGWLLRPTGLGLAWRPQWFAMWLARRLEAFLRTEEPEGSVLRFVAQKPEEPAGASRIETRPALALACSNEAG